MDMDWRKQYEQAVAERNGLIMQLQLANVDAANMVALLSDASARAEAAEAECTRLRSELADILNRVLGERNEAMTLLAQAIDPFHELCDEANSDEWYWRWQVKCLLDDASGTKSR